MATQWDLGSLLVSVVWMKTLMHFILKDLRLESVDTGEFFSLLPWHTWKSLLAFRKSMTLSIKKAFILPLAIENHVLTWNP